MQYFSHRTALCSSTVALLQATPVCCNFALKRWLSMEPSNAKKCKHLSASTRVWFEPIKTARIKRLQG
jgi:hypothetical protein